MGIDANRFCFDRGFHFLTKVLEVSGRIGDKPEISIYPRFPRTELFPTFAYSSGNPLTLQTGKEGYQRVKRAAFVQFLENAHQLREL
jgi:hypothetical protein